jgi:hypothetical protein
MRLARHPDDRVTHAALQGLAARIYGLTTGEFSHVLGTFPLVDIADREAAMEAFSRTL